MKQKIDLFGGFYCCKMWLRNKFNWSVDFLIKTKFFNSTKTAFKDFQHLTRRSSLSFISLHHCHLRFDSINCYSINLLLKDGNENYSMPTALDEENLP